MVVISLIKRGEKFNVYDRIDCFFVSTAVEKKSEFDYLLVIPVLVYFICFHIWYYKHQYIN